MTIVQMTSAYGPETGGVRTHLDSVRPAYAERGVRTVLVVPGAESRVTGDAWGEVHTIRSPRLPINPRYRNLVDLRAVEAVVDAVRPDAVEVVDKWTLPRLVPRLRAKGYRVLGFSCERLDQVLRPYLGDSALVRQLTRRYNGWFASRFATVVCHSHYAAAELRLAGADNVVVVPLGVDAERFRPDRRDEGLRADLCAGADLLLLYAGRLVPEKNVALLAELMQRLARWPGRRYRLVVAGDGPEAPRLAAAPDTALLGFIGDKEHLAALYASCDLFVFPSAVETFALSVLEALAAGCRVVAAKGGAVGEVLPSEAGVLVDSSAVDFAAGVDRALALPPGAGRATALDYTWGRTADALLALHREGR